MDKYLGFPMLKGRAKKEDFDFIVERMNNKLASWKHRLLNKAGRLAHASSVLTAIPTYFMQVFWPPQSIYEMIDRTTRDFIWKGVSNHGLHLVGWNKVTLPKKMGGLGVRKAREANTSLLGRLVWDIQNSPNKFWVQFLSQNMYPEALFFMRMLGKGQ